jgi:hypothetical protein
MATAFTKITYQIFTGSRLSGEDTRQGSEAFVGSLLAGEDTGQGGPTAGVFTWP